MICHSCASRNPGDIGLACVFLLGKWELDGIFWTAAFARMTPPYFASLEPPSSTAGEAICFIWLNSYKKLCYKSAGRCVVSDKNPTVRSEKNAPLRSYKKTCYSKIAGPVETDKVVLFRGIQRVLS